MSVGASGAIQPRIVLAFGRGSTADYAARLQTALPSAQIHEWPEVPGQVDYAVVWRPPSALFAQTCVTKAIFNIGAGVDGLVERAETPATVPVYRLEDAGMAPQMIEYVLAAVLHAWRRLDVYGAQQDEALWRRADVPPAAEFRIGMLGLGVLGGAVAGALGAFGFPLAGWTRTPREHPGVQVFAGSDQLPAFLGRSQLVVCMLPLTAATRNLLDAQALAQLPRGAHLVNVARGEIIVDADLVAALDDGQLASATLDVFRTEPLPVDHPFWHHPRITVTPHVSAVTQAGPAVAQVVARIAAFERGEAVAGAVDRHRGY